VKDEANTTWVKPSLERFTDYLNREGFRFFGEYDSRCWLGWRPASDGPTSFQ
jgi:hypothetical protein